MGQSNAFLSNWNDAGVAGDVCCDDGRQCAGICKAGASGTKAGIRRRS
jgi:hypothetical protein